MKGSRVLARNVAYNFVSQFWFILLAFFTTPYIVHKLGADAYGLLSIVSIVLGYFAFLDLGLEKAVIKYVSEYYPKMDFNYVKNIIGTALVQFIVMGLFGSFLIVALTWPLVSSIFKIPPGLVTLARFAFYVGSLGFLINMTTSVFSAIPMALQRFDLTNKIKIFIGSTQILLTVWLLYLSYSLKEIIVLNLAISAMSFIIYFIVARRLLSGNMIGFALDPKTFINLFKFGGFSSLGKLASTLSAHIEKFLIGIFMPIGGLTYYMVPYSAVSMCLSFANNITSAIFPAMSELKGLDENVRYKEIYVRSSKYILIMTIFFTVVFMHFGRHILRFWIGENFAVESTLPLKILSVGIVVNGASCAAGSAVSAANRPQVVAYFNALQMALVSFLSLIFIPRFGIVGAAIAWTMRDVLLVPFFMYFVNRTICGIGNIEFLKRAVLTPLISGLFLFLISFLGHPFMTSLVSLIMVLLADFSIYFVIVYFLSLDEIERNKLREVLSAIVSRAGFGRIKKQAPHSGYRALPVKVVRNPAIIVKKPIALSFYTMAYNRLTYTRIMVESLCESAPAGGYEHVVVNQGSADGTKEYLESLKSTYPNVRWKFIHLNENLRDVAGQDIAINECSGDILIRIDNDCRVLTKDIDRHIRALYKLIGFEYVISPFPIGLIGNLGGGQRYGFELYYSSETDMYYTLGLTDNVGGLFRCIPAGILKKIGGWDGYFDKYKDGGLKHTYEDIYICEKIRDAGFKIAYIEDGCAVEHQESTLGQHERYGDGYFEKRF